jgi:hypothetical protein
VGGFRIRIGDDPRTPHPPSGVRDSDTPKHWFALSMSDFEPRSAMEMEAALMAALNDLVGTTTG